MVCPGREICLELNALRNHLQVAKSQRLFPAADRVRQVCEPCGLGVAHALTVEIGETVETLQVASRVGIVPTLPIVTAVM